MDYETILIEKREKVGIITLNRPPENRFTLPMFREIKAAVQNFDADPEVLLIMVKGSGPHFSQGGDVEVILQRSDWEANEFFMNLVELAKAIRAAAKPVMAVIHGWATAGGLVLSLACDLIVASEDTQIGSTAIDFGLYCFFGPPIMLPPLVGSKKAFEMGVTGALMSAQEAERRGVINRVVPREKLDEAAWELARTITAKSPIAILLGKRCFYACQDVEFQKAMDHGASVMVQYHSTGEAREGMRAFLENRQPQFSISGYRSDLSATRKK